MCSVSKNHGKLPSITHALSAVQFVSYNYSSASNNALTVEESAIFDIIYVNA